MSKEYQDIHQDLVQKSLKGDQQSQFELYKLYSQAMFNICLRMIRSREEAEDVLQDSFSYAFLKLESFRGESTFGAWLKRIVVNHCINALKKKTLDIEYQENISENHEEVESIEPEYTINSIKQAMHDLPEGYRIIFSLYAFEGYDHAEIGEVLNIKESTSKSQYHRAKLKLKQLLTEKAYG